MLSLTYNLDLAWLTIMLLFQIYIFLSLIPVLSLFYHRLLLLLL